MFTFETLANRFLDIVIGAFAGTVVSAVFWFTVFLFYTG